MSYSIHRVPVRGGFLSVGEWAPDEEDLATLALPTVVALHGLTSTHLSWLFLADSAPKLRILAPDLRGRGGSRGLSGPHGLSTHLEDLDAIGEWFGIDGAIGVGHSLGAFVALLAAQRSPHLFSGLLLADGGLPLAVPLGASPGQHASAVLGRGAGEALVFGSREAHREFWRSHPGIARVWSPLHAAYCDYEVEEVGGVFRWGADSVALDQDVRELHGMTRLRNALDALTVPTTIVAATRGLFDEETGIYSERQLTHARREHPQIRFVSSESNHYLMVLSHDGAAQLAGQLDILLTTTELCRTGWANNWRDVTAR